MNSETHHCRRFNLNDISPGCNIVIIGRRFGGKSKLLIDFLLSRLVANKVIFCSKYVVPTYLEYFKETDIQCEYNGKHLQKLIDRQQANGSQPELVLAYDDVAVLGDLWKDEKIKDIVRYGSSLGMTSVFSLQYIGVLDETFIRNVDYVFAFRDNVIDNQKWLFEQFGGMFSDFNTFKKLHDVCSSEPFRCLVIDLKTPRKNPADGIFWYKATEDLPKREITESRNEPVKQSWWQSPFKRWW